MARRFLALNYREYEGDPVGQARFFGVLPLSEGMVTGLREERFLWGRVLVLDRTGREGFFAFTRYTPSPEGARNALLRYALVKVLEEKGFRLKGRIGEVMVLESPTEQKVFLAAKWGGYTPSGIRALYTKIARYVKQTAGTFWFLPAPKRRFGRFLKEYPEVEFIPEEVAKEGLEAFSAYAQGSVPTSSEPG
ncbi:hypothetical protein [Thermus caldilimi]|uniref:hypothetical protein n=1 Tax=Thermus caldilimi TaxID=2483360 RepID=UPI001076ADE8|nr:hypothetical protein [Thermus caldilimi]